MSFLNETYELSNGVHIPKIGFGTWQVPDGETAYQAVKDAIESGYIHIDTAYDYRNETSVGQAIKNSGKKREDLFITSKLPSHIKTFEETGAHFQETIDNLGVSFLDLYLIHAPWPWSEMGKDCKAGNAEAWKKMIDLYEVKKIRAIGVSNFNVDDLKDLIERTGIIPHVNQIGFFAGQFPRQKETIEFCQKHNILVEAYSPLAIGYALEHPMILEMAHRYVKTPAQILIRYTLAKHTLPLPKTTKKHRMLENAAVDFELDKDDIRMLDALDADPRKWS